MREAEMWEEGFVGKESEIMHIKYKMMIKILPITSIKRIQTFTIWYKKKKFIYYKNSIKQISLTIN